MKKLLFLIAVLLVSAVPKAATVGGWTTYLSYYGSTYNLPVGSEIYSVCAGNVFSYDTKTTEVRLFSKLDGMNGKEVQFMGYSLTQRTILLVYSDGNIDILYTSGKIVNIPQLKSGTSGTLVLTNLSMAGDVAVLSTTSGFALVDMKKEELKGYYDIGQQIYAATVFDGKVFAATEQGVITCPQNANFFDPAQWTVWREATVRQMLPFAGHLYMLLPSSGGEMQSGLWGVSVGADGTYEATRMDTHTYTTLYADSRTAVFSSPTRVACVDSQSPLDISSLYEYANKWSHLTRSSDGLFWGSEAGAGLRAYAPGGTTLSPTGLALGNYGPVRDLFYYMYYTGERLLVAGGRLDPYDRLHYPGTLMSYTDDGGWVTFQEGGIQEQTGVTYRDMTCIVEDPADPGHVFASSNTGLYEFRDYSFVRHYTTDNSPLLSAAKDGHKLFVRVDGLSIDSKGNLWMVNNQVDTVLRVLKPDGTWRGIYAEPLSKAPTLEKTFLDREGRLWVASRRSVSNHTSGLYCLDYNKTLDTLGDDISMFRSECFNEDGAAMSIQGVYAICEDARGRLWVGCAGGLFVIDDPETWFDADFTVTQPKVARNDGTNLADYLLDGIAVSAIAVDGADRKWIGTTDNGLYLVSADGTEIIHHFTADETPLLSDNIYSLAVNSTTGEVMIGTDMGLCSYLSDASAPKSDLSKSGVRVYPNPVRPEYSGRVTISGLTQGADVLVTTVGGQAVARGTSAGGTYVWDVRDWKGSRVSSGVYYIMVSTADARKGVVAKVVVI
ncbi:MAG: regulator [Alloprevotella sp.]|nr:regulator [Alloprevotella sp.]